MTWPDGIALAVGATTALLITQHQHRSTTPTPPTRRTEARHGHQDSPQADHGQEDRSEDAREEDDHPGPEDHR